jgi:calcineurin-like phosphoesterase family protein
VRLRTVRIPYQSGDVFDLYPIGDIHYGSASCDVGLLDEVISEVRQNPKARWVGIGDYVEAIAPNDKRWHAGGVDKDVVSLDCEGKIGDAYVHKLATKLRPIADQCIAFGMGNHEEVFGRHYYTDLCERTLKEMGVPLDVYTGWACLTRIVFESRGRRVPIRIYHSHGWQGGRMDGAKVNQMQRLLAWVDADIYLHGHSHSRFVVPVDRLRTNQSFTKVKADRTYVAHTGSFLKTYQKDTISYAERAGYPPTSLGVVKFKLRPHDDGVEVEAIQ